MLPGRPKDCDTELPAGWETRESCLDVSKQAQETAIVQYLCLQCMSTRADGKFRAILGKLNLSFPWP